MGTLSGFRYYLRVRYIECDAQKVVFNSRYGEYVDVAVNEFLRAIGVLPQFLDGSLDFQLVKQTVEWKDAGSMTKLPLPEGLRAALQEGAAGRVTDHAAYLEKR